jgi:hypothetical protein
MAISIPLALPQSLPRPTPAQTKWLLHRTRWVLIYLCVLTLLRWRLSWSLFSLWTGGLIGVFILDLDIPAANIFLSPGKLRQAFQLFQQNKLPDLHQLLIKPSPDLPQGSLTRSVIFEILVAALALYTVSSGTLFSAGFIMALWLRILSEQLTGFLAQGHYSQWFWQINTEVSHNWQAIFLITSTILFTLLTFLLII